MITAKCMICGRELPVDEMESVFTGRTRYMCFDCRKLGSRQVSKRYDDFFNTAGGRKLLERKRKER